ncbi:Hypothetical predicted protein [Octopus vulgaris]|uniref:Uncharacterized protein n=1 Tax=Octopus vulgaris TaxID=6645 RepID=A0AA36BVG7_OCTVU|nr:Hypothetical predicted protein [Octopus vulgaris]
MRAKHQDENISDIAHHWHMECVNAHGQLLGKIFRTGQHLLQENLVGQNPHRSSGRVQAYRHKSVTEVKTGYTYFWNGRSNDGRREAGEAFANTDLV